MKRLTVLLLTTISFYACDMFLIKKDNVKEERPIATVNETDLYKEDIKKMIPKNISEKDSVVLVKSLISNWAKQQLLLKKAQENISSVNSEKIESLVNDYRKSLYINGYKERLIKQKLDTVVSDQEVYTYYQNNKNNFKLNNDILQFDYVYFGHDFLDKQETINFFKSDKEEDRIALEDQSINYKSYRLKDTAWVTVDYLKQKIPLLSTESKEKLLKISKYIQKEDSLGVYLVAVKNVLTKSQTAPLSEVSLRIKQIILHQRKLELIRDIEKTLINDAIKNKDFKEY